METFGKLSFSMNSVATSKRNASAEPELFVNPTTGSFRVSGAVTKALGIAHGNYIMFINNLDAIDMAIAQQDENLVAWCDEKGLDITSPEAAAEIHKAFDMWGIAKGIQEFDAKGNEVKVNERITKEERITYVKDNFETIYEQAMQSPDEEFKASLTANGITKDQQIELLAKGVTGNLVNKYRGAKCANSSTFTGIGNTLNFSDSGAWAQLKENLTAEEKTTCNLIFSVNIKELQSAVIFDGYKEVNVKFALLEENPRLEKSSRSKDKGDEKPNDEKLNEAESAE